MDGYFATAKYLCKRLFWKGMYEIQISLVYTYVNRQFYARNNANIS